MVLVLASFTFVGWAQDDVSKKFSITTQMFLSEMRGDIKIESPSRVRKAPGQMTDAGYFSPFLVDHDEGGQAGFRKDQLPQLRAKTPQLMKVSDIPAEQKDISDLVFPDQIPDLRGDFSTRETGADPLPDGNGQVFLCDIHCNTSYHQS